MLKKAFFHAAFERINQPAEQQNPSKMGLTVKDPQPARSNCGDCHTKATCRLPVQESRLR